MNRKEFLKDCVCACTCAAASLRASESTAAAENKAPEDWRNSFVKQRYGKLMAILAAEMGEDLLSEALRQQGSYCASTYPIIQKHKGDMAGYIRELKKDADETITYDSAKGVITVSGPLRSECVCPFIDAQTAPKIVRNGSLGWHQYAYETILGKKVTSKLKESIVRGGKRCVFEARVLEQAA